MPSTAIISMLTPEQVHFGQADDVIARRTTAQHGIAHPERFVRGLPKTAPGGRLDQSSHLIPLLLSNESPSVSHFVDRFRSGQATTVTRR